MKRRVLYLLFHYPSITEGYIESEIRAVSHAYDVLVIATDKDPKGVTFYKHHSPYHIATTRYEIVEAIRNFRPHVVHAHRLFMLPLMSSVCSELGVPYTVRSHALDTIPSSDPRVADWMSKVSTVLPATTSSDLCLGILAFPFVRANLISWGVPDLKIHDCYPVLDFKLFYDPSPNGDVIVNAGSYMPKKRMEDFLLLGKLMPQFTFNLYAVSSRLYSISDLRAKNTLMNNPVHIMDPIEPDDMPKEYKKAQWMVYTADQVLCNVGWPVSVAEAQAAGVGICMANIRPDLGDYIGKSGYLYNSLDEVRHIIYQSFNEERRLLGFEQARKSDVFMHRNILLMLWDTA